MIRRSHNKSRRGCVECKRSHKKCDESRPACVNCATAKKQCSYTRDPGSQSPNDRDFVLYPAPDHSPGSRSPYPSVAPHTTNSSPRPLAPTPMACRAEPYVNFLHLELFQNISSNAMSLIADGPSKELWIATTLRYIFAYPYLMYETLALSAFHLSIQNSAKSSLYLAESTSLQAHALSLFNSSTSIADDGNLIPAFLFSAVLGLHFFCDTFSTPSPDLSTFLDRLVQSIRLLRGVSAFIGDSWEVIRNSDINILLQVHEGPVVDRDDEVTHAFEDLRTRLSQSHTLSASEAQVYREAITNMIWLHNSQASNSVIDGKSNARVVATWPIQISLEYTELLVERKPEALVVMAYFSILLYDRREFWAMGDSGRLLLSAIVNYLGDDWAEWLAPPRSIVPSLNLNPSPTA